MQAAFCKHLSESLREMYNTFYPLEGSAVRTSHKGEISHILHFPHLEQDFLHCNLHYLTTRVWFPLEVHSLPVLSKWKPTLPAKAAWQSGINTTKRVPDFLLWLQRALGWHAWFLSNFNAKITPECLIIHIQISGIPFPWI